MAVFVWCAVYALLVSSAMGQYGPPRVKTSRHRTTTTTEIPDAANEVLPPSPYQPPPGYRPPQEKTPYQPSSYPTPDRGSTPYQPPTPSSQPSTPYQPQPGYPTPQGQPGSSPYQPSTPSTQNNPTQQAQPSSPYQPQPSTPSQPGSSPYQPPTPSTQGHPTPQVNPSTPYRPGHSTTQGQPGSSPYQPSTPTTQGHSTPQGQPSSPYQPQPSTPSQPGSSPYQPSTPTAQGQPSSPYQPQPPTPSQPGSSPYQPSTPTAQGQPSSPYQPQPSTPSQPGSSPYQPSTPTAQGQPSTPYQPQPSTPSQQGYPTPQGQPGPSPYQPLTPTTQGQPSTPYQPQPSPTSQAGQPGPSPYQPSTPSNQGLPTTQGQPSTPYQPQPSAQPGPYPPQQPQPSPSGPGPQGPVEPQGPIGPQAYPQTPYQPAPQNVPQSVLDYQQFSSPRPQKPGSPQKFWWSNPQNSPFRPGAKPLSSYTPQPNPGCTGNPADLGPPNRPGFPPQPQQPHRVQPSRPAYPPASAPFQGSPQPQLIPIPENPKPNPVNPGNPFLQSSLQNPIRVESQLGPVCSGEATYCVPSNLCYNGIASDAAGHPTRKGPCSPGEVCCKAKKPITTVPGYPNQPVPRPQYVTENPSPKYTGPLNTTPPPECAAALKCVDILYCTAEGVMSNSPVALTREQAENRVPLADCQDVNTGLVGKCCRDPNYKDPWPAGMMMAKANSGEDDGQYHPPPEDKFDDGQYHPGDYTTEPVNPHTIKLPLGVFNQKVTPFPVSPRPGQTHAQVFPGNEDKLFPKPAPFTPHHSTPQPSPYQPQPPQSPYSPYQPPQSPYQPQPQPGQPPQSPYQPQPQPGQPPQSPYQPQPPQSQYQPQPQPGQPPQSPYQPQPQPGQPQPQPGQPQPQPGQAQPQPGQPQPQPGQPPQSPYQPQPQPGQPPQSPYQPQPGQPQQPTTPQQLYTPQPYQQTLPAQPQPNPGQECGVRREVPGTSPDQSGFGEFPWHAVIISKSNSSALCSAAIIAPNAVLTAAHCIEGLQPEDMKIKAGGFTLGKEGPKPSQIRQVGAAAIHPKYDSGSLVKDEAVIVTEEPLVFDSHIDKVCLAPSGPQDYQPTGRACYVTGFGRPALQRNSVGTPLHKVPVELIPKDQCEDKLKKTHLGKYFILNQGFSCAVPPKESELCKVDVGSPLVCERADGKYELAGVYSWDTKCSTELPGVTATCDTQWIQQVLATPIAQLREQYNRPQIHATFIFTDIDTKPGFALGYGK